MTQIDMARWAEIADKPLPKGVGDLNTGLCTMARIGYAATGKITDAPECVPASIRAFLIALNDASWAAEFRQQLGTLASATTFGFGCQMGARLTRLAINLTGVTDRNCRTFTWASL